MALSCLLGIKEAARRYVPVLAFTASLSPSTRSYQLMDQNNPSEIEPNVGGQNKRCLHSHLLLTSSSKRTPLCFNETFGGKRGEPFSKVAGLS
jgi:hypothetical protein